MNVTIHGERDLADVITLRIMSWEIIMGNLGEPSVITMVLKREIQQKSEEEGDVMMKTRHGGNVRKLS